MMHNTGRRQAAANPYQRVVLQAVTMPVSVLLAKSTMWCCVI
jgi:hypothetical protein